MSLRVGWIVDTFPKRPKWQAVWLRSGAMLTMRYRNVAVYLSRLGVQSEFYQRGRDYDAVVVIKTFTDPVLAEVEFLKSKGVPVIFDANVNYYYIWGDYPDPRLKPSPALQRAAIQITRAADYVIADSEYVRDVVRDFNPNVKWIPDNVLPLLFRPAKHRAEGGKLRLIWSGMAGKADELLLIEDVLARVDGLELWLVSNKRPPVLDLLPKNLATRWFYYSDVYYAWLLGKADAIISPRTLNNGYNLGHTEYKISLGMARNLPALASPQPAYVTALRFGGGAICYTTSDWQAALLRLRDDPVYRLQQGQQARLSVEQHYLTPVVVQHYRKILDDVVKK